MSLIALLATHLARTGVVSASSLLLDHEVAYAGLLARRHNLRPPPGAVLHPADAMVLASLWPAVACATSSRGACSSEACGQGDVC